jgi:hypothetical protein
MISFSYQQVDHFQFSRQWARLPVQDLRNVNKFNSIQFILPCPLSLSLKGPRLPHRVYPCVALWAFKPSPVILLTSS